MTILQVSCFDHGTCGITKLSSKDMGHTRHPDIAKMDLLGYSYNTLLMMIDSQYVMELLGNMMI